MDSLVGRLLGHRRSTLDHWRAYPLPSIPVEQFDKLLIVGDWEKVAENFEPPVPCNSPPTPAQLSELRVCLADNLWGRLLICYPGDVAVANWRPGRVPDNIWSRLDEVGLGLKGGVIPGVFTRSATWSLLMV